MENKRIEYLDILKFLSIILVVFCHNPILNTNSIIGNVLMLCCWTAVPCFFMTTGAIFLNKEFNFEKWIKRLIKTYIVLIVWKIIYLLFFILLKDVQLNEIPKVQILKYIFLFQNISGVQAEHMWFINAYITTLVVYPIVLLCLNNENNEKYTKYLVVIFCILIFMSFIIFDMNIILNNIFKLFNKDIVNLLDLTVINPFGSYSNCLAFFIIGGLLHKYKPINKWPKKNIVLLSVLGICVGLIGLIMLRYNYTHTYTWDWIYLQNGYNCIPNLVLSISIFVFFQAMNYKGNKIINIIAQNTLGIFYIHFIILNLIGDFLRTTGTIYNIIKTVLVIIISTIICCIMKKIKLVKVIF